MNQAIRRWIEENHQPWRSSPELSVYRGTIGSDHALPLSSAVANYFRQQGVSPQDCLIENLLESELLKVYGTISSWLAPEDRQTLEENVAFGAALTREPNACAIPCLDGYAILFDYSFDTLLISATDLYHALLGSPRVLDADELPLALNTAILSVFFRRAVYATPIPDEFVHRELTNRRVWLISVFLLGHEVGHVLKNHFEEAPTRLAALPSLPSTEPVAVLQPPHGIEFEADQHSIDLMFRGEGTGGLIRPGADRNAFWNSAYCTLGWLFSTLSAVEALARRLSLDFGDTHPPALDRWQRIAASIRGRAAIDPSTIRLEETMRGHASRSAESGELPALQEETEGEYVALPYSALMADLMLDIRDGDNPEWTPPPPEVFADWINASTAEQGRAILQEHPEMLHRKVKEMHYELADRQVDDEARVHILCKRLPLLQRSREIGVDAAFDEFARGQIQMPVPPEPAFKVPLETLQQFQEALEGPDPNPVQQLLESSSALAAFVALPETVMLLVNASSLAETQHILGQHPELLHPMADGTLAHLAQGQANEAARRKVQRFRAFLGRCRVIGVSRALASYTT